MIKLFEIYVYENEGKTPLNSGKEKVMLNLLKQIILKEF